MVLLWQSQQSTSSLQKTAYLGDLQATSISRIVISHAQKRKLDLTLRDGVWYANDKRADPQAVERLHDDLLAMRVIRVVSHGHQHDADLGLAKRAIHVRCFDAKGHEWVHLQVGKQGNDLVSTYVSRMGSDLTEQGDVVAVNRALLWQLNRSEAAWQAKEHEQGKAKE